MVGKRGPVWASEAEADLISIWGFGAEEWSEEAADAHVRLIARTCSRLIEHPELGRSRLELVPGLRSIVVDPHVVFYRISGAAIEIVRVVHQREDVETILSGRG
jgi:toxin ParE1/3/4